MTQAELKAFMQGVVVANGNSIVMTEATTSIDGLYIIAPAPAEPALPGIERIYEYIIAPAPAEPALPGIERIYEYIIAEYKKTVTVPEVEVS